MARFYHSSFASPDAAARCSVRSATTSCDDGLLDDGSRSLVLASRGSRLLEGRRALVTGAAGGIGRAVMDEFRRAGATTFGADAASGADIRCDMTDPTEVATLFDE